ncbi:hypothetical protein NDU88_003381 [Pleurodeles waltl]|uniref:Uncharacterized protein n=1 Tax=Pleurodeles waltl TaxID=8319 RepID=A0AAV7UZY4_PLEWA|nr:hypothetical protein NDU88_003381 [Pleurodeles waltl]
MSRHCTRSFPPRRARAPSTWRLAEQLAAGRRISFYGPDPLPIRGWIVGFSKERRRAATSVMVFLLGQDWTCGPPAGMKGYMHIWGIRHDVWIFGYFCLL